MLLGFISLLLTVGQSTITNICIPESVGSTWLPCSKQAEESMYNESSDSSEDSESNRRRLLSLAGSGEAVRRVLATASTDKCAAKV